MSDAIRRIAQLFAASPQQVPMPRPDPRGPATYVGPPQEGWRDIGSDGMEVRRGPPPEYMPPPTPNYGFGENALAVMRQMFEGERYRRMMMEAGDRDPTGLYDKR